MKKKSYPKRRVMTIDEIRAEARERFDVPDEDIDKVGICALVDIENMGWCKDDVTRWYHFNDINGNPAVYFKH